MDAGPDAIWTAAGNYLGTNHTKLFGIISETYKTAAEDIPSIAHCVALWQLTCIQVEKSCNTAEVNQPSIFHVAAVGLSALSPPWPSVL